MLAIELRFPAGRYHATPWGRNVNEGAPEWPPAPFRLARALAAVAWRSAPPWADERVEAVLSALERPRGFVLPAATASHVRVFQRMHGKDPADRKKIFDPFVCLGRDDRVLMLFDGDPAPPVRRDIAHLLGRLNYLGRSESWVEARLAEGVPEAAGGVTVRCEPAGSAGAFDDAEVLDVACLRPRAAYEALATRPRRRRGRRATAEPLSWVRALALSTNDLLAGGWSTHPVLVMEPFVLPRHALRPPPRGRARRPLGRFREARFALASPVLPLIEDALLLAERVRLKLMGIHRRIAGGDPGDVSEKFSGKGPDGAPATGHRHAFYLPLDEDGDGRIDHLVVRVADPFDPGELAALDRLRSVWQGGGKPDVTLALEALTAEPAGCERRRWVSLTPFVTRRHHRRGRGPYEAWIDEELRRACKRHGLPEPVSIAPIPGPPTVARTTRWLAYRRGRKGETPLRGHGRRLVFAEPVRGPFAVGDLAHFGLGIFVPEPPA